MLKGLKRGIKGVLVLCFVLAFFTPAFSDDTTYSVDTANIGMGARPMALGEAYTGLADDASAVFTNPGGLGMQKQFSFVTMSTQILDTVDYQLAGVSYPTEYGVFGFGYIGVTSPAGQNVYYDGTGATVEGGSMNYTNSTYVLSYGNDIGGMIANTFGLDATPKVSVGASVKMLSQGFSGLSKAPSATGTQTDIGALYEMNDSLAFGATIQNLTGSIDWSTGDSEKLPMMLKLGTSYKPLENVTLLFDTDLNMSEGQSMTMHGGAEWQVIQCLALRAGLDQMQNATDVDTSTVDTSYSLGVGINYAGVRFDYTYKANNEFSDLSTSYFSICFIGEEPKTSKKVEKDNVAQATDDANKLDVPAEEKQDSDANKTAMEKKLGISDKSNNSDEGVLSQYENLINSANDKQTVAQNNDQDNK